MFQYLSLGMNLYEHIDSEDGVDADEAEYDADLGRMTNDEKGIFLKSLRCLQEQVYPLSTVIYVY